MKTHQLKILPIMAHKQSELPCLCQLLVNYMQTKFCSVYLIGYLSAVHP